jgi:uncharacterized protein YndB with AHSA1/START domain
VIKIAAVIVVVLIAALLGYAATRPDTFRVERTTSINAPPERIFALITDLRSWGSWSPWEKKDPAMKRAYSGTARGEGAVYEWEGNRNIGKGRMEIASAAPPSKVVIKLDFLKPFEAHNLAEFTLEPRGNATAVTWSIHGPNLFIGKVMSVFFSMDEMIGKEFESGLATLKTVAEA